MWSTQQAWLDRQVHLWGPFKSKQWQKDDKNQGKTTVSALKHTKIHPHYVDSKWQHVDSRQQRWRTRSEQQQVQLCETALLSAEIHSQSLPYDTNTHTHGESDLWDSMSNLDTKQIKILTHLMIPIYYLINWLDFKIITIRQKTIQIQWSNTSK